MAFNRNLLNRSNISGYFPEKVVLSKDSDLLLEVEKTNHVVFRVIMGGAARALAVLLCSLVLLEAPVAAESAGSGVGKIGIPNSPGDAGHTSLDANTVAHQLIEQQKQLMAEQSALLERLENLNLTASFTSDGEQQCKNNSTSEPETDPDDEGFPWVSGTVLLVGCGFLLKLTHTEIEIFTKKLSHESEVQTNIPLGEFLQYRLDYYFSATQWAKPLLLLGVTFILILISSIILMMLLGDSLAAAMWKAWTYVADPGDECLLVL
jgi:hypothetical protein